MISTKVKQLVNAMTKIPIMKMQSVTVSWTLIFTYLEEIFKRTFLFKYEDYGNLISKIRKWWCDVKII